MSKVDSMTKAELIRSMTDEELADFLTRCQKCENCTKKGICGMDASKCYSVTLEWLKENAAV